MTSLRNIAELAGVSRMTVSRALNNHPHVRPEVAERIRALADICHYLPNRAVPGLVGGKSRIIGCVVPMVNAPFSDRILNGVVETAYAKSYQVMIMQTHMDMPLVCAALQAFVDRHVDGVLIAHAMAYDVLNRLLTKLRSNGISVIGIDSTTMHGMIDVVRTDEKGQAQLAVKYLYQLGHRRIACLMPQQGDNVQPCMRLSALRDALARQQLSTDYCYQVRVVTPIDATPWLRLLFSTSPSPTAVICYNDEYAAPLIRALTLAGLRIPHDLSVLGFGNLNYSACLVPSLTTVEQYPEKIGQLAVDHLLELIEKSDDPAALDSPRKTHALLIPPTLIERESCQPPPAHTVVLPWATAKP